MNARMRGRYLAADVRKGTRGTADDYAQPYSRGGRYRRVLNRGYAVQVVSLLDIPHLRRKQSKGGQICDVAPWVKLRLVWPWVGWPTVKRDGMSGRIVPSRQSRTEVKEGRG